MKRIALALVVVTLVFSGVVADGTSFSSQNNKVFTEVSTPQPLKSTDASTSPNDLATEEAARVSPAHVVAETAGATATSSNNTPFKSEVPTAPVGTREAALSAPVCPDGSSDPVCRFTPTAPMPEPCSDGSCGSTPISRHPGLPICPTGTSTQSVCSPMTN